MNHKPVLLRRQMKGRLTEGILVRNGTSLEPQLVCCQKPNGMHPRGLTEYLEAYELQLVIYDLDPIHLCYAEYATSKEAKMEEGKDKCVTSDILRGTGASMGKN